MYNRWMFLAVQQINSDKSIVLQINFCSNFSFVGGFIEALYIVVQKGLKLKLFKWESISNVY